MKSNFKSWAWYAFDMGNSAHALLISTIGFSLYFKDYLYNSKPEGDSLWAIITSLIILTSAIVSPLLSAYVANKNRRSWGILIPTLVCVLATIALGTDISNEKIGAILLYFVSSLGYYVALPVYNSYLPDVTKSTAQKTSAKGWAMGYVGGILAASICFGFKLLDQPVTEAPDSYKLIFLVAGLFNLALSLPMLFISFKIDKRNRVEKKQWSMKSVARVLKENKSIPKLLVIYWLIGEIAVVVTYFFAIFLREYAHLETKQILMYSLAGQGIAIIATWCSGFLSDKFGERKFLSWLQ
ncbi:MAG: MFS transporter [Chitinophagaceae bacterium]|nr:MFS transporter [Chitinophagaceae bacterium]